MRAVSTMSIESAQLSVAAKYLEDAAYTLAGDVDVTIVSRLILLSAEIRDIEQKTRKRNTIST